MTNTTLPDEVLKQKFAALVGVNYQTFASWVQGWRRTRGQDPSAAKKAAAPVRLWEAVVEGGGGAAREPAGAAGLLIELPGGCRMAVAAAVQLPLAAELVVLLAQRTCARC